MKSTKISLFALTALFAMLAAGRVFAGEHCTASTQTCLDKMATHYEQSGWAGLEGDWNEEKGTWTVTRVVDRSPAAAASVQVGDVLYGIDGHRFGKMDEAAQKQVKAAKVAGNTVTYMAVRSGEKMEIAIELGSMPKDLLAQKIGRHMVEHAQVASVQ